MALKTFGKTISGVALTVDGDRLQLQHPQTMAQCIGHNVPYQMPHADGGFLIIAEYGEVECDPDCYGGSTPAKTTCTPKCGGCGGCSSCKGSSTAACEKKDDPASGELLRFEIVAYSGFDTDGVTALITERGVEGTIKQEWPTGSLVFQAPTGSELNMLGDRIKTIEDLGCLLAVPKVKGCELVRAGKWRCIDGCYRQAQRDVMVEKDDDGELIGLPAAGDPANDDWSKCWGIEDILNLLNNPKAPKSIDDSDPSQTILTLNDGTILTSPEQPDADRYVTNPRLNAAGDAYLWDIVVNGEVVGTETQPLGNNILNCENEKVDGPVVQCKHLGRGIWWNENSKQYEVISSSIPTGCQEFVAGVGGFFKTTIADETPFFQGAGGRDYYQVHPSGTLTFSKTDYPYLAVAGRDICMKIDSNMGYALIDPNNTTGPGSPAQTGLWVNMVSGGTTTTLLGESDGYYIHGDGEDDEAGTSNCVCFQTTGDDITLEAFRYMSYQQTDGAGNPLDTTGVEMFVDTADISAIFADGTAITS